MNDLGVVVIGRNEGDRLKRCLSSVLNQVDRIVYVDSGSSDGSVEYAESLGLEVVWLDTNIPFSAGRARNEGLYHLVKKHEQLKYIQFIDGDCELQDGWLAFGIQFLEIHSTCAVVAGRRKERFPEQSIYNLLCDIEWNTPIGETKACGGDFLIRKCAFEEVEGFNPTVIAGEEPELCYRLKKMNWSIYRLDHPMTLHDAAITRFSQWWKRYVRTGHAYAQGYTLHKHEAQGYCLKDLVKIWVWALLFPLSILLLMFTLHIMFSILFSLYIIQFIKIALCMHYRLKNIKMSLYYSLFTIIGRFPQLIGQLSFIEKTLMKKKYIIIEYH